MEYGKNYTYKEMCMLMEDEELRGGANRERQLQKWRQFYDIQKTGRDYLLLKKYTEEEQNLAESHGKFTTYISNLLVEYLASQDQAEISMTYREILEMLSMVNDRYYPAKYGQRNIDKEVSVKVNPFEDDGKLAIKNMSMWFSISGRILKSIVNDAFKSMEKRSLIIANKSFRLYRKEIDGKTGHAYTVEHDCTVEEASKILDFQKEGMMLVGIQSLQQLVYIDATKRQMYVNYVKDKIYEEFGYDVYAKSWRLILGKNALQQEYKKSLNKNRLNANVCDKLLNTKEMKILATTVNEQMIANYIEV